MEKPAPDVMSRPPRPPKEPFFTRQRGIRILSHGALVSAVVIAAFAYSFFKGGASYAQATTFYVATFTQLFFSFGCRSQRFTLPQFGIFTNPYLLVRLSYRESCKCRCSGFRLTSHIFFKRAPQFGWDWLVIFGLALIPVSVVEITKDCSQPVSRKKERFQNVISAIIQFALSAAVIVVAGTFLTRAADTIAERTGWGRLLVGSLFLAGATSIPELSVDINAIRQGMPNLAVGDLFGSSLFNLLILAVLDLSHRAHRRMFSHPAAAHALSATMTNTLYILAAIGILLGPQLEPLHLGSLGIGTAAVLVAYLLGIRLVFYDQQAAFVAEQKAKRPSRDGSALRKALLAYLIAAAAILIASPFLSASAGQIADLGGLGKTFFGTTAVAFCTSLPEMVTSYAAVRMGAFDLALGNIFGSNSFNMVMLVPLDLVQPGPLLSVISPIHAFTCLATVLITAIAVMGQLYHLERRRFVIEPDAALIILLVIGALTIIYWLR